MILNYSHAIWNDNDAGDAGIYSQNIFKLRFGFMELCSYGNQTIDTPLTTPFILFSYSIPDSLSLPFSRRAFLYEPYLLFLYCRQEW